MKLWQRLLGRPASESGRLRHGDGGHEWGDRRRRVLLLPTLLSQPEPVRQGSCLPFPGGKSNLPSILQRMEVWFWHG